MPKEKIEIFGAGGKGVLSQICQLEASAVLESRALDCAVADVRMEHSFPDMDYQHLQVETRARMYVADLDFERMADIGAKGFVGMDIGYCSFEMLAPACMVTERSAKYMSRQET